MRGNRSWRTGVLLIIGLLALQTGTMQAESGKKQQEKTRFHDVQKQTEEFIEYNKSITLTPEQEKVKAEALSQIPAPCCSDNSVKTCCCPCNFAKSVWGLSNYLIAKENYDAARLKSAVEEWVEFTHSNGHSGNACYEGGCKRSFREDGCGGMNEKQVFF